MRKRGSGGGSPRKRDDLLTGPSDLDFQSRQWTWIFSQGSEGVVPVTARRAKRENGGLGEDPPGSMMTY